MNETKNICHYPISRLLRCIILILSNGFDVVLSCSGEMERFNKTYMVSHVSSFTVLPHSSASSVMEICGNLGGDQ